MGLLEFNNQIDHGQALIYLYWFDTDGTTRDDLQDHLMEYDKSGRIWDNKLEEYRLISKTVLLGQHWRMNPA